MQINAQFPTKLQCLFLPKRFKVLWGGRGAGRSWGVARALALIGTERPIRVLCVRELQKSISESVHKVLSDQIEALGLSGFYEIQKSKIIGKNGTVFSFEGIKNNTTAIKSYEGIDYCWVEEGNKVSKASWDILIPTIRRQGSEIWINFNPELDTDYTYKRFVKDPELIETSPGVRESSRIIAVHMTYEDNPWFASTDMPAEVEATRRLDHEAYLNVWLGQTRQMLEGVVFAKELRAAQEASRICTVPWDRETPVDTFWDLGRADLTSIWFAQRVAMQTRVLGYYEDRAQDIHHYLKYCQAQPYVYGTMHLPHDASAKRLGEKRTIEQIVRGMGFRVQVVPRINKKANAINAARIIFPNCWFDEDQCEDGLQRLRHYRYQVHDGHFSDEPLHDDNSNGADAFMTMGQAIRGPKAKTGVLERLAAAAAARQAERQDDPQRGLGWLG